MLIHTSFHPDHIKGDDVGECCCEVPPASDEVPCFLLCLEPASTPSHPAPITRGVSKNNKLHGAVSLDMIEAMNQQLLQKLYLSFDDGCNIILLELLPLPPSASEDSSANKTSAVHQKVLLLLPLLNQ